MGRSINRERNKRRSILNTTNQMATNMEYDSNRQSTVVVYKLSLPSVNF